MARRFSPLVDAAPKTSEHEHFFAQRVAEAGVERGKKVEAGRGFRAAHRRKGERRRSRQGRGMGRFVSDEVLPGESVSAAPERRQDEAMLVVVTMAEGLSYCRRRT